MIVLCVAMTYWTLQSEDAMKKSGLPGLQQYYERLESQLKQTVGVVRSDIDKLSRATTEALIVLDVHAMEVINNELIQNEICDTNDFKWLS
jgi:dynein heavy chain